MNNHNCVVYIAGPFRASTRWGVTKNIRNAERYALQVAELGATPICPHTMLGEFEGALPDEDWLDMDLELLGRSDAILLCPGWALSKGTLAEKKFAEELNMPIFDVEQPDWISKLYRWLNNG